MTSPSPLLSEVQNFVTGLFQKRSMQRYSYHDLEHTRNVVAAAAYLAQYAGLEDRDREILELAAWFHDTGYLQHWQGHEVISMEIASNFLRRKAYPPARIRTITACINATKMPQSPRNLPEKILCDADLINLSQCNYLSGAYRLRYEMEKTRGIFVTDSEFFRQEIRFLGAHRYHLRLTEQHFGELKANNIQLLRGLLRKADPTARLVESRETGAG